MGHGFVWQKVCGALGMFQLSVAVVDTAFHL